MKDNKTCNIIRDILPLYVEGLIGKDTKDFVESHLEKCTECKKIKDDMTIKNIENYGKNGEHMEDENKKLFEKIKKGLTIKKGIIVGLAAVLVIVCISVFYILYEMPLISINPNEIKVTAEIYNLEEIADEESKNVSEDFLVIRSGDEYEDEIVNKTNGTDNINKQVYTVRIKDAGIEFGMTKQTIDEVGNATLITWESPFEIKDIEYSKDEGSLMQVAKFKTSILGNKGKNSRYSTKMINLEMRKIDKISYLDDNGDEIVMWEKKEKIDK